MDEQELVAVELLLTGKSMNALEDAAMIEGLSQGDIVNRAVQVYCYLLAEKRIGGKKLAWCEVNKRGWKHVTKFWAIDWY
jgi:hypothetical protein